MLHTTSLDKAGQCIKLAKLLQIKIATAESCTGGLLSAYLTALPGSSAVFERGFVTYSNDAKTSLLDVHSNTINEFGAVSQEVAHAMAIGALKNSKAHLALSITGIAGPSGGSIDKPVGLVYMGLAYDVNVEVKKHNMQGDRNKIRNDTAYTALTLIEEFLLSQHAYSL